MHESFSVHATAAPSALAVAALDATLTYGELERRANQLAHHLQTLGVRRETLVGLCVERSAALIVGALAILKAGGAYVALDPQLPSERLDFMVRDSGVGVIVTSATAAAGLTGADVHLIVPEATPALEREPTAAPDHTSRPGDLAYVIYTSGSTGNPKGVLVEHASLSNLVVWHQRAFAITDADRATQIASPGFDASVWEMWPYLTAGASLHVPGEPVRRDPIASRDWLVAQRITVSFMPTALAELAMALDWPAETALRFLLTGGDALHRRPSPSLPFPVYNNYGPTEGTVVATSGLVTPGPDSAGTPTLGRPISGMRTHIVDEQLSLVADGETGELLIGGPSVARGYLNRDPLTDEKFIADRFGVPEDVVYRTGDRVRRRPDGELEFHGRLDDQVQIRGNRVELGEISARLHRHPAVRSAVAMLDDNDDDDGASPPRMIAYVSCAEPRPGAEELREHLAQELPAYMVPDAFGFVDEMPLMANGKVDRARLPSLGAVTAEPLSETARPRTDLERVLESIVTELLDLDEVGVEENFFMLGGHSLLGAQLITRISTRCGVEMSLRNLFDNPTVAQMALEVERLLIADVEAMSDAEAARQLAAGAVSGSAPGSDKSDRPGA